MCRRGRWSWACPRAWCARCLRRISWSAGGSVRRMSERPQDSGLTSGDPLAPGPDQPRHESGLPGLAPEAPGSGYTSPPPPGAFGTPATATPPVAAGRYQLAGWWSRVGATLIDGLIIGIGALIILAIFGGVFSIGFFSD